MLSLDLNITIAFVLALIAIMLVFMNWLVIGPFVKHLEERHEQLDGSIERSEKMLKRAEEQAERFAERIKVATTRGLEARDSIRTKAQAQLAVRIEEQRASLAVALDKAMAQLDEKRKNAMEEIEGQAQELAQTTASKLLGRTLS